MANKARKHHYVPRFYLSGFTTTGSAEGHLWVHSVLGANSRRSKPANTAVQRDFYAIDSPDYDQDAVEGLLSDIEAEGSGILRDLEQSHKMPTGEDALSLMLFLAVQFLRVPKAKNWLKSMQADAAQRVGDQVLASEKRWKRTLRELKRDGKQIQPGVSLKDVRRAWRAGDILTEPSRTYTIGSMLDLALSVTPILNERDWSIFFIEDDTAEYCTCDSPVAAVWNVRVPDGTGVGLALREVDLFYPVSKHVLLWGSFKSSSVVRAVSPAFVAARNANICNWAEREVYSSSERPPCLLLDGSLGTVQHRLTSRVLFR